MKKWSWVLAVAATTVLFFQCQKDIVPVSNSGSGNPVISNPVKANLQGAISDENNRPAAGVTLITGTATTTTDDKGFFRFDSVILDKNTTLITALKDGYFKSYRVFAAILGQNEVAIKLVKKTLAGTVSSSTGGEASLLNGAKVSLPSNGVLTVSSDKAYSGDIKVYSSYIDPKGSDFDKTVPGSPVANDKDKKRVILSSYGMLAVELSSSVNEKLQIKSGSTATLTIPIPLSSLASAPATIPLWYLDETTGIWQEEGSATKQGSNYVGDVKHFSYWNAAYPQATVTLSMTLQTPDGLPLPQRFVDISGFLTDTSTYASSIYRGYTDSLGRVITQAPTGVDLSMKVYDMCSGIVVFNQDIPSLTQDKDLGILKVEHSMSHILTFNGKIVNCNNEPVTNGYAMIDYNSVRRYAYTNTSGEFTLSFSSCSLGGNFSFSGVDMGGQQQSQQKEMTSMDSVTDIGTITACGSAVNEQYINYKIDGVNYSVSNANGDSLGADKINSSDVKIYGFTLPSQSSYISFQTYQHYLGMNVGMRALSFDAQDSVQQTSSILTMVNIPDSVNQYYEGNFDGNYLDSGKTHTISATFRVKQN